MLFFIGAKIRFFIELTISFNCLFVVLFYSCGAKISNEAPVEGPHILYIVQAVSASWVLFRGLKTS